MGNTIYASFNDPDLAEKAAGALLDHGVRAEDISLVRKGTNLADTTYVAPVTDSLNDAYNPFGADGSAANDTYRANRTPTSNFERELDSTPTKEYDSIVARQENAQMLLGSSLGPNEAGAHLQDPASFTGTRPYDLEEPADTIGSETYATTYNKNYATGTYEAEENPDNLENAAKHGISTTTSADAEAGAIKGAGWGAGVGAVAAVASLFVPGLNIATAGGAIAIAIGGLLATTVAGAGAGAVTGYLKDQGVDHAVAEHYENTILSGGALLAVTLPSGDVGEFEARSVIEKYGAINVNAYTPRGYLG